MKLRAVMDTNVLVSGVLWRGVPFHLLRWAEGGTLIIYTSLEIMAEADEIEKNQKTLFTVFLQNLNSKT